MESKNKFKYEELLPFIDAAAAARAYASALRQPTAIEGNGQWRVNLARSMGLPDAIATQSADLEVKLERMKINMSDRTDDRVKILQQRLNELLQKEPPLKVDGQFGEKTRDALREALWQLKQEGKLLPNIDIDTNIIDWHIWQALGLDLDVFVGKGKEENEIENGEKSLGEHTNWTYPLATKTSIAPKTGGRQFGAPREGGKRAHAGIDLIVPENTNVLAVTDGVVQTYEPNFYAGTSAVSVLNNDGSVTRYTEIEVTVSVGDSVKQGDKIGYTIKNNAGGSCMLHIEAYDGTESGALTQSGNSSNYKNVPAKNYKRRADLLDPTFFADLPMFG